MLHPWVTGKGTAPLPIIERAPPSSVPMEDDAGVALSSGPPSPQAGSALSASLAAQGDPGGLRWTEHSSQPGGWVSTQSSWGRGQRKEGSTGGERHKRNKAGRPQSRDVVMFSSLGPCLLFHI